jgi:hypothetical protein
MEFEAENMSRQIRKKWPRRNDFRERILKKPRLMVANDETDSPMSFDFLENCA